MEDLSLIYINVIGNDWRGVSLYEFIFSDTTEGIDGVDWDAIPASGRPSPPDEEFVIVVGRLTTDELSFHVIQESDLFSVWDALDGVVALAWENMDTYEEYPESRLSFHFGDKLKEVESKLYAHDLRLEYNKKIDEKLKENN